MDRLSTLRLFIAAVEQGSIAAACRTYGISTTSGSRRLQELEAHLGTPLLDRTTRSLAPTEAGRLLYDRLRGPVSGILGALAEAAETGEEIGGVLLVVARRSYGMRHVVPLLASFLAAFPHVEVDLELTERLDIMPGDGIDIVIRHGRPEDKSSVAYPLASGSRILCASPDYLHRNGCPEDIEALQGHACLTYRRASEPAVWMFRSTAEPQAHQRAITVGGPLRSTSGEVLRSAAIAGAGLVLLPTWMVAGDIANGRLVRCLEAYRAWPAGFDSEILAVHRRFHNVPGKISAFVAHLLEHDPEVGHSARP